MALTDLTIKKAKAKEKPYIIYDSLGLFVLVKPNGSKLWRQKYQLDGKERTIAHGSYLKVIGWGWFCHRLPTLLGGSRPRSGE